MATEPTDAGSSSILFRERRRWPGPIVRYHVEYRAMAPVVRRAAIAWNRSGAKVRWVPVPAGRAQVTVERVAMSKYAGWAGQLYRPGTDEKFRPGDRNGSIIKLDPRVESMARRGATSVDHHLGLQIVAHEMGHILGLAHTEGCAVMNPRIKIDCPVSSAPDLYRCGLLEADDVGGAAKIFGGEPIDPGPGWCRVRDLPKPPEDLQVTYAAAVAPGRKPKLEWQLRLPTGDFLYQVGTLVGPAEACPEYSPRGKEVVAWKTVPGSELKWRTAVNLAPGSYCATAFSIGNWGVVGPTPAVTTFTVPG